jgi:hypothetical protein
MSQQNPNSYIPAPVQKFIVVGLLFSLSNLIQQVTLGQGRIDTIALTGQSAPDGNGTYNLFSVPLITDAGDVGFTASFNGTSGGTADNFAIVLSQGGLTSQLARKGQSLLNASGTISTLSGSIHFDNAGHVFFNALASQPGVSNRSGIHQANSTGITELVANGQVVPGGNGVYASLQLPFFSSNSGHVAFRAPLAATSGGTNDNEGVFLITSGAVSQLARKGEVVPDANGAFLTFDTKGVNDNGQVLFQSTLIGTEGGSDDNAGLFLGSAFGLQQIVRAGQSSPTGNGTFSSAGMGGSAKLNDLGAVAFNSSLAGTSGGANDDFALFLISGGSISEVVREGMAAPDGNGEFLRNDSFSINNQNKVAFHGRLRNTIASSLDDEGVYLSNGSSLSQLAREGQIAPGSNGQFQSFTQVSLSQTNLVAFSASLRNTLGATADDQGIFVTDGIDLLEVSRHGTFVSGHRSAQFFGEEAFNDFGQVALQVRLSNGTNAIERWTPDLHWRSNADGIWDDQNHWTLGLNPAFVHDTFIDSDTDVTVFGPEAATSVNSLSIGGGIGNARLLLENGSHLQTSSGVSLAANGTLEVRNGASIIGSIENHGLVDVDQLNVVGGYSNSESGTLSIREGEVSLSSIVSNDGLIAMTKSSSKLSALAISNTATIVGRGVINSSISNLSTGQVFIDNGRSLVVNGGSDNQGLIRVENGSQLEFSATVDQGMGGTLIVSDSSANFSQLNNSGSVLLSGNSTIGGTINNGADALIRVVTGNSVFTGDIIQNGIFSVEATATVLGEFSGVGGFKGGGTLMVAGNMNTGASPATVTFEGSLTLNSTASTLVEIAGTDLDQFDQWIVFGNLNLNGQLEVALLDGFMLGAGESYLIADIGGTLSGTFSGLSEGAWVGNFGNRDLFISYSAGDGNDIALFTAVPEPSAALMIGSLALFFVPRRKR